MVSPLPMETHLSRDVSKLHSKFTWQLDGNMRNNQWAAGSTVALPLLTPPLPPTLCQRLLFKSTPYFLCSLPVSCSFLSFDNPFSQICYCHREVSHCFQPYQPPLPSSHPVLPPTSLLPTPFPLPCDSLWVATVSWDTLSSLALTRGKLSLLKILTFPLSLGSAVASFSSPFC